MKFSYYLCLIAAIAACFQFYFHRLEKGSAPAAIASGKTAEGKAVVKEAPTPTQEKPAKAEDSVDRRYKDVRIGFKRRAKYLNLKDPE